MKTIRAATDVGGTFTDLVYFVTDPETGAQKVSTAKADTTPPDYERGVMNVIAKSGVALDDVAFMAHGTTVVINAVTERNGVVTALITSAGFRDVLEIARGNRPDFFNLHYVKPPAFVPRRLRRELPGVLTQKGVERAPLDLSPLPGIVDDFRAAGVQAIAICLINAYADPTHEMAVLERVRELWPEVSVVASHQITREWREYERTSTAVLSAYVQPVAERYLGRLVDGVKDAGFDGQLYIMQSNCGVDSVGKTKEIPITMVESGPASGFWGAAALGRLVDEPNILALDIGGTTAKCSLIEGGQVRIVAASGGRSGSCRTTGSNAARCLPATRRWCRWSTWSRSAREAEASPGWTSSASCTSVRARPAPSPVLPPTAAAGTTRRRQTRTSPYDGLILIIFAAVNCKPTWPPSSGLWPRSPIASSWTSPRRRAASCASPTTT
jgi:N-methylhydantoinase A/oxoprolinase/acetone carboxylase beta subunit